MSWRFCDMTTVGGLSRLKLTFMSSVLSIGIDLQAAPRYCLVKVK